MSMFPPNPNKKRAEAIAWARENILLGKKKRSDSQRIRDDAMGKLVGCASFFMFGGIGLGMTYGFSGDGEFLWRILAFVASLTLFGLGFYAMILGISILRLLDLFPQENLNTLDEKEVQDAG